MSKTSHRNPPREDRRNTRRRLKLRSEREGRTAKQDRLHHKQALRKEH